jgi:hypothetical protein
MAQDAPTILKRLQAKGFEVKCLHHAEAIATIDFPTGMSELEGALEAISIPVEEIVCGRGRRSGRHAAAPKSVGWLGVGQAQFPDREDDQRRRA